MKRLFWIIGIMLAALGCVRELPLPDPESDPLEEGKVKIYFTLPLAEGTPSTKVLDEGDYLYNPNDPARSGGLKTLHVAVFGSSGYLKEYVKAENLGPGGEYEYVDAYGTKLSVPLINFSVTLSLSPKERFVHLLGNCPEEILTFTDTTTVFSLLSGEGEPAYWQMLDLPNGIEAKVVKDEYGNEQYQRSDGDGKTFQPDDNTQDAFKNLFLIRNWAKLSMVVDDDAQFTLEKFALVNFPKKGVIAASISDDNGKQYFVRDYDRQDDKDLEAMGYQGVLPEEKALYNTTVPSLEDFTGTGPTSIPIYNPTDSAYMYERPVPDKLSTFVIVYGTYTGGAQPKKCFYKIDLSDDTSGDDKYYPIYRNFQYKIQIHKIEAPGYDTPQEAADSPGSVSVSANTSISGFSDISDGTARLAVQPWMAQSYNKAGYEDQLFVKFFSDVSQGANLKSDGTNDPDPEKNPVTFELLSRGVDNNGQQLPDLIEIVANESGYKAFGKPDSQSASDNYGWRALKFRTTASLPSEKTTQTLRVKGVYKNAAGTNKTLYRDILITLLPYQKMHVWCTETDLTAQSSLTPPDLVNPITVEGVSGKPVYVNMALPKDLPESMFPLEILIEPEEMTLTPNVTSGMDLPVVYRKTISDQQTEEYVNSFQYIRNLDWSEYITAKKISIESTDYALISAAFLTNRHESGTTIWVDNEFFIRNSTSFRNTHEFTDLSFRSYIKKQLNANVAVRFEVERRGDTYPTVQLITEGMEIKGLTPTSPYNGQAVYSFTPTADVTDFTCLTKVQNGDVSFAVNCDGYTTKSIQSHHFKVIGFLDGIYAESIKQQSYVVYGRIIHDPNTNNLAAPFGYCHELGYPTPVRILNSNNDNRYEGLNYGWNSTTLAITSVKNFPNGTDSTYHEIGFKTNSQKSADYSFRLVAVGYVEEAVTAYRFTGTIGNASGSVISKDNVFKSGNSYGFGLNGYWSFVFPNDDSFPAANVAFGKKNAASSFSFDKGLKLSPQNGAEEFTMTVNSKDADYPVYYVEVLFDKAPDELSVEAGGQIKQSMNDKAVYRYLWKTPENPSPTTKETTLTIKTDHDVTIQQIIIKSIKYTDSNP